MSERRERGEEGLKEEREVGRSWSFDFMGGTGYRRMGGR